MLLELISKEQAMEDTIDLVKANYNKKIISLSKYLDLIRDLSEKQFYNLAMKRKILTLLKQSS